MFTHLTYKEIRGFPARTYNGVYLALVNISRGLKIKVRNDLKRSVPESYLVEIGKGCKIRQNRKEVRWVVLDMR